jgi:hypothetical protein
MPEDNTENLFFVQYGGVKDIFHTYWSAYGGLKALFTSPYFHLSFVITFLLFPLWTEAGWWADVITVLPNIIGFSLGGYAIWLAIGDEKFREIISGDEEDEKDGTYSPYIQLNAAFVHFILVQFIALLTAFFAKAVYSFDYHPPLTIELFQNFIIPIDKIYVGVIFFASFLGFFVFIYALMSAIAATFSILRYSTWYDEHITAERQQKNEEETNNNN